MMNVSRKMRLSFFYGFVLLAFSFPLVRFLSGFAQEKIQDKIAQIQLQIHAVFQKELQTYVSFEQIQGTFLRTIRVTNVFVRQQFRDDLPLIRAESVTFYLDLFAMVLTDKPLVENIEKVVVDRFHVYVDENIQRNRLLELVIGRDDGEPNVFPLGLEVQFREGTVSSAFLDADYPSFRVQDLFGRFYLESEGMLFRFEGFIEAQDPQNVEDSVRGYRVRSAFLLEGHNYLFDKKGLQVRWHFGSFWYRGYFFQAVALDFSIFPERIHIQMRPSSHSPFLLALEAGLRRRFLETPERFILDIQVFIDVLSKRTDVYLHFPAENKPASVFFANYFKGHEQLGDYMSWLDPEFQFYSLGRAFFQFHGGELTRFFFDFEGVEDVFQKGDRLSFEVRSGDEGGVLVEDIVYEDSVGPLLDGFIQTQDSGFNYALFEVETIRLVRLFPKLRLPEPWDQPFSAVVELRKTKDRAYSFDFKSKEPYVLAELQGFWEMRAGEVFVQFQNDWMDSQLSVFSRKAGGSEALPFEFRGRFRSEFLARSFKMSWLGGLGVMDVRVHGAWHRSSLKESFFFTHVRMSDRDELLAEVFASFQNERLVFERSFWNAQGVEFSGFMDFRGFPVLAQLQIVYLGRVWQVQGAFSWEESWPWVQIRLVDKKTKTFLVLEGFLEVAQSKVFLQDFLVWFSWKKQDFKRRIKGFVAYSGSTVSAALRTLRGPVIVMDVGVVLGSSWQVQAKVVHPEFQIQALLDKGKSQLHATYVRFGGDPWVVDVRWDSDHPKGMYLWVWLFFKDKTVAVDGSFKLESGVLLSDFQVSYQEQQVRIQGNMRMDEDGLRPEWTFSFLKSPWLEGVRVDLGGAILFREGFLDIQNFLVFRSSFLEQRVRLSGSFEYDKALFLKAEVLPNRQYWRFFSESGLVLRWALGRFLRIDGDVGVQYQRDLVWDQPLWQVQVDFILNIYVLILQPKRLMSVI